MRDCEHQSTSTVLYIFALAQHYTHRTVHLWTWLCYFIAWRCTVMFWRMQTCSLIILLNWNYCDLQLQYIRWFVLFSVVHTICHCQSWVMTIIISNSTTSVWVSDWDFRRNSFDIYHCQWMCHCKCECDHGNFKTNQNTGEKVNCSSLIFGFFSVLTQIQMDALLTTGSPRLPWDWWIRNDIETVLPNAHFRYRGSIEYRDTWDGIVIVAPISGIAQH